MNLIYASTAYGGIGLQGKLPWDYPEDLAVFKALTEHHTIIMGSKTWDSLPRRPLPNRHNVVITSKPTDHPGAQRYELSLQDALGWEVAGDKPHWVIGGGNLINQAHHAAAYICHTLIPGGAHCDVYVNPIPEQFLPIDEIVIKTASGMDLLHTTYFNESHQPDPRWEEHSRTRIREALRAYQEQKETAQNQ